MNPIDAYLDSVFSSLPATTEAIEARADIRTLMTDKYEELTSQGMSAEDAHKQVIDDFGDISEVAYALGLGEFVDGTNPVENNSIYMDDTRAQAYVQHRIKRGYAIAFGVAILFAGINIGDITTTHFTVPPQWADTATFTIFAIALGISLFLFLKNPYKAEKNFVQHMPMSITLETRGKIQTLRNKRSHIQTLRLALGIALILIGLIANVIFFGDATMTVNDALHTIRIPTVFSPLVDAILDLITGLIFITGIGLLIIRGVEKNAYMALLKEGKFARKNTIK